MTEQSVLGLDEFGSLVRDGVRFQIPEGMSPVVAARLGNRAVEGAQASLYVLASPFSFERELRFRGALQLRRLVSSGRAVLMIPSEPYEDEGMTVAQAIRAMSEDAVAALRVLSSDGQSVLWTRGRPYLFYRINGLDEVPRFLVNAMREASRIDGAVILVGDGRMGDIGTVEEALRGLGVDVSVMVAGGERLIYGFVEGEVRLMESDPVSRALAGREIDIEPEEPLPAEAERALSALYRLD